MKIIMPRNVEFIIDRIYEYGFEAFIVGGCVRDKILGNEPNDYDITTSAKPNDILNIFKEFKIIDNGIKHGTVGIIIDNEVYEITTYRIEGEYENNRKPKEVEFTLDLIEDLKRRDFTINAMAYNYKCGLIDKFNGLEDLQNKLIKTVGNPDERFTEDALRIMRAVRFSCKLGFTIEEKTLNSIYKNSSLITNISIERINDEFTKTILSNYTSNLIIFIKSNILKYLNIYSDLKQADYSFLEKNINILEKAPRSLEERLILVEYLIINNKFVSINENIERIELYNLHMKNESIVNKLRYSNKIKNTCNKLIQFMIIDEGKLDKVKVKKILNEIGIENFIKILNLKKLYYDNCLHYSSEKDRNIKKNIIDKIIHIVNDINNNRECYTIKELNINGNDLKQLGYRGSDIGKILNFLLNKVQENPHINHKVELIKLLNKDI